MLEGSVWTGDDVGSGPVWTGDDTISGPVWTGDNTSPTQSDWRQRPLVNDKHIFSSNKERLFDFDIRRDHDCRYSSHHTNCKSSE